ncbi:hypothetical protein [Streptomyces sp. NBC_00286]|uniref:hypothetical protein n=1 Tax=Streptomyces sp. NBC_00286 TaxID=2975701 RepID=UPI002E2CCAFD|nr:hypothetical protein [Streptomyces sp. NBC_00286]
MTVKSARIATVKASVSGSVKPAKALASLKAKTRLNLVAAGKVTPASATVTARVKAGPTVFFAGTTKASGSYTPKTCNAQGTGYGSPMTGKAVSWTSLAKGAVNCTDRVSVNSLAAKARAKYCRG